MPLANSHFLKGGRSVEIHARAPLRIDFAGGFTDVPPFCDREGGCVLNATISKYSYGALTQRSDHLVQIESVDFGVLVDYDPSELPHYNGVMDIVKAAVHKVKTKGSNGFNLLLHSDVLPGTGLGSSSSVMVMLVGLIKEYENLSLSEHEIAQLAFDIERNDLHIKGGYQDQYAATFGGFNYMEFRDGRVVVNPLRVRREVVNELEHNLLLCYTGATRLSAQIIDDVVGRYERDEPGTQSALRALKRIASETRDALLQGRLTKFGELMNETWVNKQKMSDDIVTSRVAEMHESALKAGAIGGKLSGAGGGGYLMFYCRFNRKHKVAEVLTRMDGVITDFGFDRHGLETWIAGE